MSIGEENWEQEDVEEFFSLGDELKRLAHASRATKKLYLTTVYDVLKTPTVNGSLGIWRSDGTFVFKHSLTSEAGAGESSPRTSSTGALDGAKGLGQRDPEQMDIYQSFIQSTATHKAINEDAETDRAT